MITVFSPGVCINSVIERQIKINRHAVIVINRDKSIYVLIYIFNVLKIKNMRDRERMTINQFLK